MPPTFAWQWRWWTTSWAFGGTLQRILKQVLSSDLRLGLVYLRKVDLADAYMRLWVKMGDVPSVAFLIPKKNPSDT